MSQHFPRAKPKPFLLRFFYLLNRLIKVSNKRKLNLFLDLEWIFQRLSHETAIKYYAEKGLPIGKKVNSFLYDRIGKDDTVLDLGCNLGEISYAAAKKAAYVLGIDYNAKAIEIAKSRYNSQNLEYMNVEAFSYLSSNHKNFDILILSHILEHLDNPKEFILKFKSFFKSIYIEVPDLEASVLNQYRIELDSNFRYMDDDHLVEFDREDLMRMLTDCGLQIMDREYVFGIQRYWCKVN